MKDIKIKTPYGDKNWSFIKKMFDNYNDLLEVCKKTLNILYDNMEDMKEVDGKIEQTRTLFKEIQNIIKKAEGK